MPKPVLGDPHLLLKTFPRLLAEPALVQELLDHPDNEVGWLKLASWMADNGYDDVAETLTSFWPATADTIRWHKSFCDALTQLKAYAPAPARYARRLRQEA